MMGSQDPYVGKLVLWNERAWNDGILGRWNDGMLRSDISYDWNGETIGLGTL